MSDNGSSQPLILPSKGHTPHSKPLSRLASGSALALGGMRGAGGLSCVVAPILTAQLFRYDLAPEAAFAIRLFGVRELVLGGLLFSARNAAIGSAGARGNLRTIFLANLITDSLDIGSVLVGEYGGTLKWDTAALFSGGAVAAIGLAVAGLRGLKVL